MLLRDRRFCQGSHAWPERVGLEGAFARFWRGSVISLEGESHKAQRRVVQKALAEPDILAMVPRFEAIAKDLMRALPSSFEAIEHFTEPYAGRVIAELLGLPMDAAAGLARDASTLGLAMGLDAKRHESEVNAATDRLMGLAADLLDAEGPGFVSRLKAAAVSETGIDHPALLNLIVICIFGGVDTTRAQLGFAIAQFCNAPEDWRRLKAAPEAIPQALDEVIRHRPTTTWATREAMDDLRFEGLDIAKGTTVHVLVHATATDPGTGFVDGFDPFARRKSHFGFGGGAHHCLGHFVARTDMAAALRVMLREINAFAWDGEPLYLPDSGNTSPAALPVRIIRA